MVRRCKYFTYSVYISSSTHQIYKLYEISSSNYVIFRFIHNSDFLLNHNRNFAQATKHIVIASLVLLGNTLRSCSVCICQAKLNYFAREIFSNIVILGAGTDIHGNFLCCGNSLGWSSWREQRHYRYRKIGSDTGVVLPTADSRPLVLSSFCSCFSFFIFPLVAHIETWSPATLSTCTSPDHRLIHRDMTNFYCHNLFVLTFLYIF